MKQIAGWASSSAPVRRNINFGSRHILKLLKQIAPPASPRAPASSIILHDFLKDCAAISNLGFCVDGFAVYNMPSLSKQSKINTLVPELYEEANKNYTKY